MIWRKKRAFTLIEIMIVVLIIGILLAIAIPNFMTARATSRANACISNLEEISAAKEQLAMDNRYIDSVVPTQSQLVPTYIKNWPICPSKGTYTINNVGTDPTCSIGGTHSLTTVGQ
jgi:prepilin-type N-terminal cleavage/methylation domain-containing protein